MVALVGPAGTLPELSDSVEVLGTTSGYEAAAELLSGPSSALLVDLGRITAPHVPLLALAGRLKVPIVAFGTVSASLPASTFAAVRLVSAERVGEALEEVLSTRAAAKPQPRPAEPAPSEPSESPAPPPARLAPAKASQRGDGRGRPVAVPAKTAGPAQPAAPRRPVETLTQAELDALLGELDALLEDSP